MTLSIHDLGAGAQSLRFIDDYASECERAEDLWSHELSPPSGSRRSALGLP